MSDTINFVKLSSPAFQHQGKIPKVYTCQGKEISPPLNFEDIPPEAKSLVLLMDDPDVPAFVRKDQMWDHWVVFNIPPTTKHFAEGEIPPGVQGNNTSGKAEYEGPCPPDREHRYFFHLYAINTTLDLDSGATKQEVLSAIEGHTIACAELIGLYKKD